LVDELLFNLEEFGMKLGIESEKKNGDIGCSNPLKQQHVRKVLNTIM
jgi:hypothetical protein